MINRHTLPNGLRIIHHEDTTTQMVAVNLLYNVGARNEDPHRTGYAHLMEHLMFEGSINIPNYDTHVQLAGGENNAWTNNDLTNYYITIPKSNVETAFWLESDRMLGLALTEQSVEIQKVPLKLISETILGSKEDYRVYLPDGLPESFTKKDFLKLSKDGTTSLRLEVLRAAGVIIQTGKQGKSFIYSISDKEQS